MLFYYLYSEEGIEVWGGIILSPIISGTCDTVLLVEEGTHKARDNNIKNSLTTGTTNKKMESNFIHLKYKLEACNPSMSILRITASKYILYIYIYIYIYI